jgi:hypothetical protein
MMVQRFGIRRATQSAPLPLFPVSEIPKVRARLEGYAYDDLVLYHDLRHPAQPERRIKARVIFVDLTVHELTLRTEDHRLVTLNPTLHPHLISRRSNAS